VQLNVILCLKCCLKNWKAGSETKHSDAQSSSDTLTFKLNTGVHFDDLYFS